MQTSPESGTGTSAMAKGGSGPAAATGAATFRLVEGATMTLPDGSSATVRQGALELADGQRLPLPEAGGSVTFEKKVVRPDGRTALVRHTIRVGEPTGTKTAEAPLAADTVPAEVPAMTSAEEQEDASKEALAEARTGEGDKGPMEGVTVAPESPVKVQTEGLEDNSNKVPTDVPNTITDNVPAKPPADVPSEIPTGEQAETQEEMLPEVQSEAPKKEQANTPAVAQNDMQLKEPTDVPAEKLTEVAPRTADKPDDSGAEVTDYTRTEVPTDVPIPAVRRSTKQAADEETPFVLNSLDIAMFSSTPKASDVSGSAKKDAQTPSSAPERKRPEESHRDSFQPDNIPAQAEQLSTSGPVSEESLLYPGSASEKSCVPLTEGNKSSLENSSVKTIGDSQSYCESTEDESNEKLNNLTIPTAAVAHDASQHEKSENSRLVNEEEEEKEPHPVGSLAHQDSLRLQIHVPRLQRRSDESGATDSQSPSDRRAASASQLNDAHKRHKEDEEMRTVLNSILHKLGYGMHDNAGGAAKERPLTSPGSAEIVRPEQADPLDQVEGPVEPEPVSVPKVISYFESISPQRVESPIEKRKWRSSDHSPSPLRSPRSARSPEPPRDLERPGEKAQSLLPPRKVNFANSAQRVLISSTSEPDEMEDIPIPRPDESSFSGPELVQTCLKEVEPVITTQPTRLTAILVQNPPVTSPKADEETAGDSLAAEDIPQDNESSERPYVDPLSFRAIQTEESPPKITADSATPVSANQTHQPSPELCEPEAVTQSQLAKIGEAPAPDRIPKPNDMPDSSETTPLISPSTADKLNRVSAAEDGMNGGVAPIQAEPLPRPSSAAIQGELPLSDFPTSPAVDPTELPDGASNVLMTENRTEEATAARPNDPLLSDESSPRNDVVVKRSNWFGDCMEICCCCWVP